MLGGKENKGKGCILKGMKSDITEFNPKSPAGGSVNDGAVRSSTPKVGKGKGSTKGKMGY